MRGGLTQRYKGTWSIILDQGYQTDPATGKPRRRQKWITVRGTRRDAEAKLAELVHDTNRGTFVEPHKRTLGEWLEEWIDKAIKPPARTLRAYETYRSVIAKHLKPTLGAIPLQQLKATDLKRYYTEAGQGEEALAPATLEQHHTIVDSALQAAVLEGLVQRNVAKLVVGKPHAAPAGHQDVLEHCWEAHEAKAFLARSPGPPARTLALLRAHRAHQAELKMANRTTYHDHGLIFAKDWPDLQRRRDTLGDPLQANNLGQREYARLLKAAGVRPIKFHGLRHTCATLLLQAGVPPQVVQQRLGHKKIEITLSVYAHALPSMQQDAAERLAAILH